MTVNGCNLCYKPCKRKKRQSVGGFNIGRLEYYVVLPEVKHMGKKHANCNTNRKKVNPKSDSMAMK